MNNNKNNQLLLLTNTLENNPKGGRQMLQKLNYFILKNIFKENLTLIELKKEKLNLIDKIFSLKGNIDGLTNKKYLEIINIIEREKITKIFIDGSNLGFLAKKLKKFNRKISILTFFHNVEAYFFLGLFKYVKSPKSFVVLIVNYFAELNACIHSDELICLSENNKKQIKKLYNYKKSIHVSPISLFDQLKDIKNLNINSNRNNKHAIFIGTNFYANKEGILWFSKYVAPYINIDIYVIGADYRDTKDKIEFSKNIIMLGKVDNLSEYYNSALFVLAPIFSGSGMKTKIAEALMHGKKIIGTKEAFSGYEDIINKAGHICNNAQEFIKTISNFERIKPIDFDNELRTIYLNKYSYNSALYRFKKIFKKT